MHFPPADFPVPELVSRRNYAMNAVNLFHGDKFETLNEVENYFHSNQTRNASGVINVRATRPGDWWTFHVDGVGLPGIESGRLLDVANSPFHLRGQIIRPEDTFRTLIVYHGDYRLSAGSHFVPEGVFKPTQYYFDKTRDPIPNDSNLRELEYPARQILSHFSENPSVHASWIVYEMPHSSERLVRGADYGVENRKANPISAHTFVLPKFPVFRDGTTQAAPRQSANIFQNYGDFDNGMAYERDGSYTNKPDEGNIYNVGDPTSNTPYFTDAHHQTPIGPSYFSPNRMMPGPGMFGSLPRSLWSGNTADHGNAAGNSAPWQTLLFRPQSGHPGAGDANKPPDHLWLDFFWMPVVEPYAISEPFSTAGKINMNYAIEPFAYIRRATGMVGLLRSQKMMVIPRDESETYKRVANLAAGINQSEFRKKIDTHETLTQFEEKFAAGEVFVSPSQICKIELIPEGNSHPLPANFWSHTGTNAVTGDNTREKPYTDLQGRLTTKSNTYTVHYRVQALRKAPGSNPAVWNESSDRVVGEYRGSTTIERYITPKDERIPDYATAFASNPPDLGHFYKWRVINTRQFAP
jgi:uncharacterized protein (TIGR02600 family)